MAAGDPVPWGAIATRLDQAPVTADSALITTTETTLATVTGFLTLGRRYRLTAFTSISSSVAADQATLRIRDGASGQLTGPVVYIPIVLGSGFPISLDTEYVAAATGSMTFTWSLQRTSGTGNVQLRASTSRPSWLRLDYVPV